MDCHHCGACVVEHVAWLGRWSRVAQRLRAWVEALTQVLRSGQCPARRAGGPKIDQAQPLATTAQAVKLDELLAANAPLAIVDLLKTELKEVWFAPSVREGALRWYRMARESGLAPAIQFAKRLRKCLRGILASALYPMNSSILEGVNNRIKVIKRRACGFRDSAYFFLKIKADFPGKAR